ncbi:hypothetical protein HZB78_04375 [Candidatus Collierbacteria bacterium]|nr:hypothetical protein [Candidatus Collierbacteria bacterium]
MNNLKVEALKKGFDYLDTNKCGEELIIAGLAAIASPEDISKGFKAAYIKSHKLHLSKGYFEGASAALHLAAGVNEGMEKQEKTFERQQELVHGIVLSRRRNLQRSLG